MAGYIGSKAIIVNSTSSNVTGDLTVDTNTLYVDSANNRVGVGTTTPATALDVTGTVTADGLTVESSTGAIAKIGRSDTAIALNDVLGQLDFTTDDASTTEPIRGQVKVISDGTSGNSSLYISTASSDTLSNRIKVGFDGDISFYEDTGTTPKFFWDASAESLGIGYTTPSEKLGVNGFIGVVGTHTSPPSANPSISRVDQNNAMGFFNNSTERMRIDSSGNLLVGKTSATGSTSDGFEVRSGGFFYAVANSSGSVIGRSGTTGTVLFFRYNGATVGSVGVTGSSTSYNTSSDYRLKEDVQPMTGASERVLALNPVNFAWKSDGSRVDGFLAHEAQAVVPEAITGEKDAMRTEEYEVTPAIEATYDEDGNILTEAAPAVMGTREVPEYQGIDQSKLVPLLTAALQEALNEITDLKARVAALEAN